MGEIRLVLVVERIPLLENKEERRLEFEQLKGMVLGA